MTNSSFPSLQGFLVGGILGLTAGFLGGLDSLPLAFAGLAGLSLGGVVAWFFDAGLDQQYLSRYGRWLLPGEAMVIVQAPPQRLEAALAFLRQAEGNTATLSLRRTRPCPAAVEPEPPAPDAQGPAGLRRHAAHMAADLEKAPAGSRSQPLLKRVRWNERAIERTRRFLAETVQLEEGLVSGAEWFLDNAYLIRGQVGEILRNLPEAYYAQLPVTADGYPRVYMAAAELVAQNDARLDKEDLIAYVQAFQEVSPLTLGELWAFPLMLRCALVEYLQHLSQRVCRRQHDQEMADFWAHRLLGAARRDPDFTLFLLAELTQENPSPSAYFAIRLLGQLQNEEVALAPLQGWLQYKLDSTFNEALQSEQNRQAADQVSIANAVQSLRYLARLRWREIFEQTSLVEAILSRDPGSVYAKMDFETRDRYRDAVEDLARWSGLDELTVANRAIELAGACPPEQDERCKHVGYYLIDRGRPLLERHLACRVPPRLLAARWVRRHAAPIYLGGVMALTIAVLAAAAIWAVRAGESWPSLALCALLFLVPASEIGRHLVNQTVTRLLPPAALPRMSFVHGIPPEYRTLVVVPTILSSSASIREDLARLEVRYLANADPALHYALLSDFADADAPELPEDGELLAQAIAGVERLNGKHGEGRFLLLHRPRSYSRSEGRYIGWERKRGKLEELNRLLQGQACTLHPVVGDPGSLAGMRFVLTLDADTILPRDTARQLVETMAHPLNRPSLNARGDRVVEGYGLIQPRVCTSLPSATATLFTRIFADPGGLDPYCRAVSDVYQDLTGEGSFYGKGLYDPRVFHSLLGGRFPEETILSHDLLEGSYLRTGFASDLALLDQFPQSYTAYTMRQHRWIRGDWQIVPWIRRRVPRQGGYETNPLSGFNRWKILDNLRRSLVPPALLGLLMAAWFLADAPAVWTIAAVLSGLFPALSGLLLETPRSKAAWLETGISLARSLSWLVLLPHQAILALDAIGRVLYRLHLSRRRLLEWETAAAIHERCKSRRADRGFLLRLFLFVPTVLALASMLRVWRPAAMASAASFLLAWSFIPVLGWLYRGALPARPSPAIRPRDLSFLRELARQTWRFFDDFVTPGNHWLPPDNYQEALHIGEARRTSPTNIGMWLLSALAARELGYLTATALVERATATFSSLRALEKFNGHLLNWYSTESLEPLRPRFVSTVDSGNLLASLWTFAAGCRALVREPVIGPGVMAGLRDTLANLLRVLPRVSPAVAPALAGLRASLENNPGGQAELAALLDQAQVHADTIASACEAGGEGRYWADRLAGQIRAWREEIERFLPWLARTKEAGHSGPAGEIAGFPAPSPADLAGLDPAWAPRQTAPPGNGADPAGAITPLLADYAEARGQARKFLAEVESLLSQAEELAAGMSMAFLYDRERSLFSVGYNVADHRLDTSYYDLLASEARLASYVSIARGDVDNEHWSVLGRPFNARRGRPVLLSWNGTAFEYLMPPLWLKTYRSSLLQAAGAEAVRAQIDYARRRGIPWGISEAAFSALDAERVYQYRAFGIPGLGLKRGLEEDLVVAPYATALALPVAPRPAVANLRRLEALGLRGPYGLYESLDFTRERRPEGERGVIIYAYMAHHQGMSLVALANAISGGFMQALFHADPRVRATEPLLFERVPDRLPETPLPTGEGPPPRLAPILAPPDESRITSPNTPVPRSLLLGNGHLSVMVTNAGGGFIRWRGLDLARWQADTTRDNWGSFIYLKDLKEGVIWSAAYQPLGHGGRRYAARYAPDRAEIRRRDLGIETKTEIAVAPEDDAELRRMTLTNLTGQTRQIEVTSYLELALAPHGADRAHPSFNKLFIATEYAGEAILLAGRRRRSPAEEPVWAAHLLALEAGTADDLQYETDRARFLGRGRDPRRPAALEHPLSNTAGYVLDPIFSLRCRLTLAPGSRVRLAFVTVAAETRAGVLALAEKYRVLSAVDQAFELAWTHAQLELRHLGLQIQQVLQFQELGSHVIYPNPRLRPPAERLRRNTLGQARLWAHGLSGDLPIIVLTVDDESQLPVVRELLLAHSYLRLRGLQSDLVILNSEGASYGRPLQERLQRLIGSQAVPAGVEQPGGVFLRSVNQLAKEDLNLLLAVARVALVAARGPLAQQLATPLEARDLPPRIKANKRMAEEPSAPLPFMELPYFNGYGGFSADGREYITYLGPRTRTPAPWLNIMANPEFGAAFSESGGCYAWYINSQSNRLMSWANDPVTDPLSLAVYLRDEESGAFWSPTPAPVREEDAYRARHGQGYTVYEHNSHAIEEELTFFVPAGSAAAPVLVGLLRLRNRSTRRRRLSVFTYNDWTLGTNREETQQHVVTRWDPQSKAILARNAYHPELAQAVAFAALSPAAVSYTGDRTEFIGRNGSLFSPAALDRRYLSGRTGAGLDPCAAQQVMVDLEPGKVAEIVLLLGEGAESDRARRIIRSLRQPYQAREALNLTKVFWDGLLGMVQVRTPILAVNFLLNRWLLYQTLSCRVWARSALYQSGGAYGFRDQLQDVMGLLHAAPDLAREHILRAAGRQFTEGDVQHWWHPPGGGGTRTRCTDDMLWLIYAAAQYVRVTGDTEILQERAPFLEGRPLEPGEQEIYLVPSVSMEDGSLLEHCRRAAAKALTAGPHGLPLMGSGDWNDGMNRVGEQGRGESVWLAWFLVHVLRDLAELCESAGEAEEARFYREKAADLVRTVEEESWDGEWYRRAYYDDGQPMGSRDNLEAAIDSLPQSWGVIAGAAQDSRAAIALRSAEERLVRWEERLIRLFWPPFDRGEAEPGYIKAYPPGVRENGGQYTQGAIWLAMALARRGEGGKAVALMNLLNPVEHAHTPEDAERYKVEPYVVSADVYALPGREGMGGWSWYTGSSAWMYRVWLEEILGFQRRGETLRIEPAIPADWPEYAINYRYGGTLYQITVANPDRVEHGVVRVELDGTELPEKAIPLRDDGGPHEARVVMGRAADIAGRPGEVGHGRSLPSFMPRG